MDLAKSVKSDVKSRLSHIETWIFDLDNTLYSPSTCLFHQIDVRMKKFIAEALSLDMDDAFKLQKTYYKKYGTTLKGLMINDGIDPDAFLEYVHDIDHSVLKTDASLDNALRHLPGRKFIHTNGAANHAHQVVNRLGVSRHFDAIFDIRASNYIPKPELESYLALVKRYGINTHSAAMFEDSLPNLTPAARLGMLTVWVRPQDHTPQPESELDHCSFITENLTTWLNLVSTQFDKNQSPRTSKLTDK